MKKQQRLFGSPRRTEILILLSLLENTYPSEVSRLLEAPLYSVQKILDGLEVEGVVASRKVGRTRVFSLNPGFFADSELRSLLKRLAKAEPGLRKLAEKRRSRPRRARKPLRPRS